MKTQQLLGISFTNATEQEALDYLFETLLRDKKKSYIVTPNPEIVVYALTHSSFKTILNQAQLALPDGVGITLGAWWLGKPFSQRITGVDFMLLSCRESVKRAVKIGLLGAGVGVAERTAERLRFLYPGIQIVFVGEEWPPEGSMNYVGRSTYTNEKTHNTSYILHDTSIDVLFVAFGHPKQEEWIAANLERLPVKVAMGVGGAFDYLAGDVVRAPGMVRKLGLEWLFRLIRQPWRWKRQLSLFQFGYVMLKEKLGLLAP